MNTLRHLLVGIVSIIIVSSVVYAVSSTWQPITPTETETGKPITQSLFDRIRENLDYLNQKTALITSQRGNIGIGTNTPGQKLSVGGMIESTSGGYKFPDGTVQTTTSAGGGVPSGAIMAFYLSTCPTGWIAANGTNGTPDLRGEFIRGLDSGRGVDSGRGLATNQGATRFPAMSVYAHNTSSAVLVTNALSGFPSFPYDTSSLGTNREALINISSGYEQYFSVSLTPTGGTNAVSYASRPRNVALLYCQKQ